MIVENKPSYYIGTVTYVENDPLGLLKKDRLYHEAVVAVPGVFENVLAFPARTNLDEPKVGDLVVVCAWDPVYNSYCTYEKLKEDKFVGFRASGKMVQITDEKIVVGVFDEGKEYKDDEAPETNIAHLEMDKNGNIEVHAAKNITIEGGANCTITIKGNAEINVNGNLCADVKGSTELSCPDVTVTGGTLTIKGQASVDMQGPFCGLKNCVFSGCPQTGSLTTT